MRRFILLLFGYINVFIILAPENIRTELPYIFKIRSMIDKKFKLQKNELEEVIIPMGGCYATDSITVDGNKIRIMIRDDPSFEHDSGWFFMSGLEDQEYIENPDNIMIYRVNTIANYDESIIPYLDFPVGSRLERCADSDEFILT